VVVCCIVLQCVVVCCSETRLIRLDWKTDTADAEGKQIGGCGLQCAAVCWQCGRVDTTHS